MGSKSISNELLLEWQILSKILRSLWVIDKSTYYLICSRHKYIEKHILKNANMKLLSPLLQNNLPPPIENQ